MPIKLDLGKAWETAMALLKTNRSTVFIVAGVFFFLPLALLIVLLPPNPELAAAMSSETPVSPDAISELMIAYLAANWWVFALLLIATGIGTLAIISLLGRQNRPTVGEAITLAAKSLPTYIAVFFIGQFLSALLQTLPTAAGAAINPALGALLALVGFVLSIYVSVKISLTSPVIATDGVLNPVKALIRSWQITRGNSLRLFAFYVLLFVALFAIFLIVILALTMFAIFGEQVGLFAFALGISLFGMLVFCVIIAVQVAVHWQLSGGAEREAETFS